MYNVYNLSNVFYKYDFWKKEVSLIGNEKEFIDLLARDLLTRDLLAQTYDPWDKSNLYLDNFICSPGDFVELNRWQFLDGMGRCINPKIYEKQAYELYEKKYKKVLVNSNYRKLKKKEKTYKGIFRRTPVENIRKYRGGPSSKKPIHIRHMYDIYENPEYKGFNRGDKIKNWYEGRRPRCVERNWKSQRKKQWKER